MASYGYQSDHINLIADNLRDRYKSGFPILKELIQNADDAKPCRRVFGLHPGFKGQSSHPLLQGPGLWLFNDGQFKKDDERAIRSFGLNTKAGESASFTGHRMASRQTPSTFNTESVRPSRPRPVIPALRSACGISW